MGGVDTGAAGAAAGVGEAAAPGASSDSEVKNGSSRRRERLRSKWLAFGIFPSTRMTTRRTALKFSVMVVTIPWITVLSSSVPTLRAASSSGEKSM
jgi:hypothetical protein